MPELTQWVDAGSSVVIAGCFIYLVKFLTGGLDRRLQSIELKLEKILEQSK